MLEATVTTHPPSIQISWSNPLDTVSQVLYRKDRDAHDWGESIILGVTDSTYLDTNVLVGVGYEYRVVVTTSDLSAEGYLYGGIELPLVETRGRCCSSSNAPRGNRSASNLNVCN